MARADVSRWMTVLASALLVAGCESAPEEGGRVEPAVLPEGQREFVTMLGVDTIAIESFVRTDDRISGVYVSRNPVTIVGRYVADLTPEGRIGRLEIDWSTPATNPDGAEPWTSVITVEGNTATVVNDGGASDGTTEMEVGPGALPSLGQIPMALFVAEQAAREARAAGTDEYPLSLISSTRPQPTTNAITVASGDTVSYDFFGNPMYVLLDDDGALVSTTGYATTMQASSIQAEHIDVPTMASDFAARDANGTGLGVPSPAATATATLGGARIEVAYSQPAKRGRDIWGGLVPYGEVWRTGANSATMFTTDTDLILNDMKLPAGSYTLWTTFTDSAQVLIVNRQTGQWGTAYDESQDFGRVAMTIDHLRDVVERFTISFQEMEGGGVMHLEWDHTRFSVPIRFR
ncbi:MAG: hypothetical protein BMS9Abin29_1327 [Gemmatimonadota bacterium]|nr:MAG: hypothetical protein BMS9Abin29_1327 [Gemmatimonadota bacterium]